jgi:hypothetical protein
MPNPLEAINKSCRHKKTPDDRGFFEAGLDQVPTPVLDLVQPVPLLV